MGLKVLWQILRSRWLAFLVSFALVLGAVAAWTLSAPKVYMAGASLVVDPKLDPIAGTVLAGMSSPSYLMTQVDIIQSTRVASRVVAALKLAEVKELRDQWMASTSGRGDFEGWLTDLLRSNLDVKPSRGSNVISLYYSGADPRFVAEVANGFVKAYLETTLEMRTSPARDYSKFFDANSKALRDQLEAAQTKLSAYHQSTGLVVSDGRLDTESQRLADLTAQLVAVQAVAADSQSRDVQAQAQGERMADVMNSPMVAGLRADLARQEAQLEQLSSRLGDNHPNVRELKSGIAENRVRLEVEIKRAQSSVGINNKVNQSRVGQARAALEEQRDKVLKMRVVRDEASVLARDAENAQRAYEGVLARLNLTNLESQTNQSSVAPLERATAPNRPSSPRTRLNFVLGAVAATLAGLLVVGVRESLDRRVRAANDFETLFDHPLVAVVPSYKKASMLRLRKPKVHQLLLDSKGGKSALS
jgi:polysaccharide biosynthesis transport protein